jgi:hypothetical protein
MSALGQKQTCAVQEAMSALPPKADMCSAAVHVRFGPKADIRSAAVDLALFPSLTKAHESDGHDDDHDH